MEYIVHAVTKSRTLLSDFHFHTLRSVCVCVCLLVAQLCPTLGNLMDYSPSGSSVHGFLQARQEYWSGLPFPSPGDLPDPGIEPGSPALQADALLSEVL